MPLWPFRPTCPIDAESKTWVDARMRWLAGQFGIDTWRKAIAIEPTDQFFPDKYDGTQEAVQRMLQRICGFMKINPVRVVLRLYVEDPKSHIKRSLHIESEESGTAGLYHVENDREIVAIEATKLAEPQVVVATLAHELAHVRLLGEGRLTGKEEDHEPVTDLATVFFGMGIFNANSTFRFSQWAAGGWHGWRSSSLGYLKEPQFGYALGLWSTVRGEDKPAWMRHLRPNLRSYMKQTLRYLAENPPVGFDRQHIAGPVPASPRPLPAD